MLEETKRYVSCDLIENGLDFNVCSINFCCRAGASGGGFKALIPNYKGELIDWDKFFEIKNYYRKKLQQGEMIEECKGCIFLREDNWDTSNCVKNINLNSWANCNSKCIYCTLEDFLKETPNFKQYNVLPVFKDMIEKGVLKKGGVITIAGGEPTIIPEFEKLINLLIDNGMDSIRVLSNGTKFSKAIERGLKEGIITIVISPDAGTKKTYEKIKQIPCFDKVYANLKKYAKAQKSTNLVKSKFIIIPDINDNEKEINEWLKKTIESNVKGIAFDVEQFWYDKNRDNIPQKIYDLLNYIVEQSKKLNLMIEPHDRATMLLNKISD